MPEPGEEDGPDPEGPMEVDENGEVIGEVMEPEHVDKDGFYLLFQTAFDLPGQLVPDLAPLGIKPEERPNARAASDAIHSLLEIYYPNALLPNSPTIAHVIAAAPFLIAKIAVARLIFRERAEAKMAPPPKQPQKPQPDSQPPQGGPLGEWELPGQREEPMQ